MIAAKKMLLAGRLAPNGQAAFTTPGTYSWTCPRNVREVCVVAVGGSSQGGNSGALGGGGLGWRNKIKVNPGQSYLVVVGDVGQSTYFISESTVCGQTASGTSGGGFVGDGGGRGGDGAGLPSGGGGGAGGYSGKGGAAFFDENRTGQPGEGGAGGSGGSSSGGAPGGDGGGVGLLGQDSSGAGGSIGGNGIAGSKGDGIRFGGGRGQNSSSRGTGGLRIIWGRNRAFPATNTGDV